MTKLIVKESNTLYSYLRDNLQGKSKNNIKSLLKNKCIYVNNTLITKYDYPLKENDYIEINPQHKSNNLEIIYEDKDIIVVNKPPKLLTISSKTEKENTLYRRVSAYLKEKKEKVFIIHRLDFDTSGIIIFAKNQKVQKLYQDNWHTLAKIREYISVVEGITDKKGHIESYLKETKTLYVYSSKKKDGHFSVTDYERIDYNNNYSLLKIHISTGRRNQIRCHMKDIGHPIIGDIKYGAKTNPIGRFALHANYLEIVNPLTKIVMKFNSPVPQEFLDIVKHS